MFENFGFTGKSDFFRKAGDRLSKGLYILTAVTGTILMTVGGSFAGGYEFVEGVEAADGLWESLKAIAYTPHTLLGLGGLALLFGAFGTYADQDRQHKRIGEVSSENQRLKDIEEELNSAQEEMQINRSKVIEIQQELVATWLKGLCRHFDLNSEERATVYYEYGEAFYLLARYSKNPVYAKVHRQKFPLNQGVISKAWQHNRYIDRDCPHADEEQKYSDYLQEEYDYEPEKIENLTMRSCRYLGKAIVDADVHTGVIVFESTRKDFLTDQKCEEISKFCDNNQGQLAKFVRDSLSFDREIILKKEGRETSVDDDFLNSMGDRA